VQAKAGDSKRAFFARPVRERAAVVVAGVVMNALLAIVIFYVYLGIAGFKAELPLIGDHKFFLANEQVKTDVVISAIQKESPAEKAQIPEFAKVVAVNGKAISSIEDFTSRVKALQGKEIALSFIDPKSNKTVTKRIVPRSSPPKGQGALGVNLFGMNTVILTYDSSLQKVLSGITYPANLLSYNFDLLGKLVQSAIKNRDAGQLGEGVAGPVGIYSLVGTIVQIPDIKEKVLQILNLAGILSISLAFFNILPIPALDGGRLFFILIEGIFRKKVNPKYETIAHTVGMAILLFLILLITFNDVLKIL